MKTKSQNFLENLFDESLECLEYILNDKHVPTNERAKIAFQILDSLNLKPDVSLNHGSLDPVSTVETCAKNRDLPQDFAELSTSWKQWVLENKLLGNSDESIIDAMVQCDISPSTARSTVSQISSEFSFQACRKYFDSIKKLESILGVYKKLSELSNKYGKVERIQKISKQDFFNNYYVTSTPVIITDMMGDWNALSSWTPDYLKSTYGEFKVEIQANRNSDPHYELNKLDHRKVVKFNEYVDMVISGDETNDYYLVANNGTLERPEFQSLFNDFSMPPELLDKDNAQGKVFFWFGPAGTVTPLHHDQNNLMMAQIMGRKRWRLIAPTDTPFLYNYSSVFSDVDLESPDYQKHPLFRRANVLEVILEPGEIIFVPVGWWHQVKSLDVSISLSFTNLPFPNEYEYYSPNIKS